MDPSTIAAVRVCFSPAPAACVVVAMAGAVLRCMDECMDEEEGIMHASQRDGGHGQRALTSHQGSKHDVGGNACVLQFAGARYVHLC